MNALPLLNNFSQLSMTEDADLRAVFDGGLVKAAPTNAVVSPTLFPLPPGH